MRGSAMRIAALWLILVPSIGVSGEPTPPPEWKAGVAMAAITPEQPMWLDGYSARNKPSEGKVHDLLARVLSLSDAGGARLVIVAVDLLRIPRELRDGLAADARERFSLPAAGLLLNASHTHCGPMVTVRDAALWGAPPEYVGRSGAYLTALRPKLADLIGRAIAAEAPARLSYSHARAGFAMNRRLPTERGFINSPNPDGPVDHDVPVLRVDGPDGALRAVAFGYACHSTTLSFYQFCGDYSGFATRDVEEAHPGATALFFAGCGGDQNPYPRHGPKGLEYCAQHGRALANGVETALLAPARPVRGPLRRAISEIELPFARPAKPAGDAGNAGDAPPPAPYPYLVQAVRFGDDLLFVALAGEVVVGYSLRLKAELAGPAAVWVAGYSNDVFGYVPTARILAEGGYEPIESVRLSSLPGPFAPEIEVRIIDAVKRLAGETRAAAPGGQEDGKPRQ